MTQNKMHVIGVILRPHIITTLMQMFLIL